MTAFMRSILRRLAPVLAIAASAAALALAAAVDREKPPAVDPDQYAYLMSFKVEDVYDLEQYFVRHQFDYLPIAPPFADFVLSQSGIPEVIPFDAKLFPEKFSANLVGAYENSVPVYPLTVIEDWKTRETVFFNADGKEIYVLPPAPGYDPFAYLKDRWPWLYTGRASWQVVNFWQSIYDPARVQLRTKLIPTEYVEPYLFAQAKIAEAAALMQEDEEGGGGMMLLMGGESDSNIVFTAMRWTNGVLVRIAYPEDFTSRLDVFTSNDLLPEIWSFGVRELPTSGTNQITWVDTNSWVGSGLPTRFYAAGNADLDTDGDGYADARELMVYKTDPANSNSRPVKVSGTVSYNGIETGAIFVVWVTDSNSWSIAKSIALPGPGAYTNAEVGNNQSYWIKAFRDVNANNVRDGWEPWGLYSTSPTLITGDTTGINITMADVPSIFGSIDYIGSETGNLHVLAMTTPNGWTSAYESVISWVQAETNEFGGPYYLTFPADFSIVGVPISNYWIRAFMDSDSNGAYTAGEPAGQFASYSIPVSNRVAGINFTLAQDADGDGMPDGWEITNGLSPGNPADAAEDPDADGLSNLQEFLFDTSPHAADTDLDGLTDGEEVNAGVSPLYNPLLHRLTGIAFSYDNQDRLTAVTSMVAGISMTYDDAANIATISAAKGE